MITRLVEMFIRPDAVEEFAALYAAARPTILTQPGCHSVMLVRAIDGTPHFATWSVWDDEQALDAYRTSAFFRGFWPNVRVLFAAPPRVQTWEVE